MDKKRYSNTFILSFKNKHADPPVGFHPVYIKQKRVQCTKNGNGSGSTNTNTNTNIVKPHPKGKWDNLEQIRAFANSDNSFIQRTRNRSTSEVLLGEVRSLLNKITDKTFNTIIEKLAEIDYEQFDDDMINQSINVYLLKAISDKDYIELYAQIGCLFNKNFKSFKEILTREAVNMFNKLFETNSEIQKAKCLGFMRILPHFQKEQIILHDIVQHDVLDVICKTIQERKNNNDSYAHIAAAGGCGMYIELLCKYCEHIENTSIDYSKYIDILNELKGIKTVPSRMRFMIEDTLIIFKK